MKIASAWCRLKGTSLLIPLVIGLVQFGCTGAPKHSVPAYRLSGLTDANRSNQVPINMALLGQSRPPEHMIGPGDTLSVYIHGVLPMDVMQPPLTQQANLEQSYYPPNGTVKTPPVGPPIKIAADGTLQLPLVGRVELEGLTVAKATERIIGMYRDKGIIQADRERILVNLMKPRVSRVMVIREDSPTINMLNILKPSIPWVKHGRAQVVDLPAYENDVLHALTHTNGLPGIDAKNEVLIFRNAMDDGNLQVIGSQLNDEASLAEMKQRGTFVRIPLKISPCDPLEFDASDVILNDGDVLFVPSRDTEVFYTGGLLPPGEVQLPRDKDLDIVEAMSYAGGGVASPAGAASTIFRTGGPQNFIPPTRGIIVRKLPDGQILPIRVDLNRALIDPRERVIVQPNDMVMLFYTPKELAGNILVSFVNFTFLIPTSRIN